MSAMPQDRAGTYAQIPPAPERGHGEAVSARDALIQIRNTAIQIVGAEIYLCRERMMRDLDRGEVPSVRALRTYENHIRLLQTEFASREDSLIADPIERHILELAELSRGFLKVFEKMERGAQSLRPIVEDYFNEIAPIYQELNAETVLAHLPGAKDLGLQLIEFDTDLSGYCPEILDPIEKLERQLLIDVSLKKPQEGFGGVLSVEQLLDVLRLRQSRLFVAMIQGEVCGFYLPVFNPASVREFAGAHFKELVDQKVIDSDALPGWVHITGTARTNRLMMARAGIHLYGLFDQVVMQHAAKEGLTALIGAVREGDNANTAVNSHIRFGWESTSHTFLGADGVTPYRTIIRPVPPQDRAQAGRPLIGLGSHFEVYAGAPAVEDRGIERAHGLIDLDEAHGRCKKYFGEHNSRITVTSMDGYYGHYFMVHCGTSSYGSIHSLQQVRPGVDYWQYLQGQEGQDLGTLDELLPLMAVDMGLIPGRRNLCFDD